MFLLGDVFSAFGGFLEEKFRAYDYNIGRDSALEKMSQFGVSSLELFNNYKPQEVIWPPTKRLINASVIVEGNPAEVPQNWTKAKDLFGKIAAVKYRYDDEGQRRRDSLAELNVLLDNVDLFTKNQLREQILARVKSLSGYILNALDKSGDSKSTTGNPGSIVRKKFTSLGFLVKAAWASIRGRSALEDLIAKEADQLMKEYLRL